MTSEERSCLIKMRVTSQGLACRAMADLIASTRQERGALQVYACRFCHGWHIGHIRANRKPIHRLIQK